MSALITMLDVNKRNGHVRSLRLRVVFLVDRAQEIEHLLGQLNVFLGIAERETNQLVSLFREFLGGLSL